MVSDFNIHFDTFIKTLNCFQRVKWQWIEYDKPDSLKFELMKDASEKFPSANYQLPAPTFILAQRKGPLCLVNVGRNYLIWDQVLNRLARIDSFNWVDLDHPVEVEVILDCMAELSQGIASQYYVNPYDLVLLNKRFQLSPITAPRVPFMVEGPGPYCYMSISKYTPLGWHKSDERLRAIDERFQGRDFGLGRIQTLLAHNDHENYLIESDGTHYLWNELGQYLDRIDKPQDLFGILKALDAHVRFEVTPIRKSLDKEVAARFGIEVDDIRVPCQWFDRHPSMNTKVRHFSWAEYGLQQPEPILIRKDLKTLLVRCNGFHYLWYISEGAVVRISQPRTLSSVIKRVEDFANWSCK